MDRYWLLTSTFYGNWLPGDPRGFVSRVRDTRSDDAASPHRREHDLPGTECDRDLPGLLQASREQLRGEPVRLASDTARVLAGQFRETATCRHWHLLAFAILANHVHLVVGVDGDPDPARMLADFKAYGSRALTAQAGRPASGNWWTSGGSKRKLPDPSAVAGAVAYVRNQHEPLLVWVDEELFPAEP
ncbi:MAG: hypothetical protein U0736_01600 [Gemmataceae bacterium]